jgi:sulfide dehydrogenase cytochrome subunit
MTTLRKSAFLAAALVACSAPASAADGNVLALSCAACHGTNGKSPGSIPAIAGKAQNFLETSLADFKSGKRTGTVMNRLAKGYRDDQIKALAVFFSEQK